MYLLRYLKHVIQQPTQLFQYMFLHTGRSKNQKTLRKTEKRKDAASDKCDRWSSSSIIRRRMAFLEVKDKIVNKHFKPRFMCSKYRMDVAIGKYIVGHDMLMNSVWTNNYTARNSLLWPLKEERSQDAIYSELLYHAYYWNEETTSLSIRICYDVYYFTGFRYRILVDE